MLALLKGKILKLKLQKFLAACYLCTSPIKSCIVEDCDTQSSLADVPSMFLIPKACMYTQGDTSVFR